MNDYFLNENELTQQMKNIIKDIEDKIENKIIPETYPDYLIKNWSLNKRREFIKKMGFVLISLDWIKPLSNWIDERKCLEVMSGSGALSYALQQQGINIIATDNFSWGVTDEKKYYWGKNFWTNIENIDAIEAVKKYGTSVNVVIMSWAYMDDTAYKVLQVMREVNPFCVMIFIGENSGGCTADDNFYDNIQEIENQDFKQAVNNFKQWRGIYDHPRLIR